MAFLLLLALVATSSIATAQPTDEDYFKARRHLAKACEALHGTEEDRSRCLAELVGEAFGLRSEKAVEKLPDVTRFKTALTLEEWTAIQKENERLRARPAKHKRKTLRLEPAKRGRVSKTRSWLWAAPQQVHPDPYGLERLKRQREHQERLDALKRIERKLEEMEQQRWLDRLFSGEGRKIEERDRPIGGWYYDWDEYRYRYIWEFPE